MKLKTTKTLANLLQQKARENTATKNYTIYQTKLTERQFAFMVDLDTYDHENDFDYKTNKYNVIVIEYPQDYYACNKYITTNDLHKLYYKSDKTLNGLLQEFFNEIEI